MSVSSASNILFSIALADRINLIKEERVQAQAEALKNAELNQQLIKEQNIILGITGNPLAIDNTMIQREPTEPEALKECKESTNLTAM